MKVKKRFHNDLQQTEAYSQRCHLYSLFLGKPHTTLHWGLNPSPLTPKPSALLPPCPQEY